MPRPILSPLVTSPRQGYRSTRASEVGEGVPRFGVATGPDTGPTGVAGPVPSNVIPQGPKDKHEKHAYVIKIHGSTD